jgi:oligopeptidase B
VDQRQRGIVFTEVNENWRSYRARYHRLGAPGGRGRHALRGDRGARLQVGVGKSQDRSLIFISTGDNATSEVRFVPPTIRRAR